VNNYLPSRVPNVVVSAYIAVLALLFVFALVTQDDFRYSSEPLVLVTLPLSLLSTRTSDVILSIIAGGLVNALLLYLLMVAVTRSKKKHKGRERIATR
jgi:hypothetical protein